MTRSTGAGEERNNFISQYEWDFGPKTTDDTTTIVRKRKKKGTEL